MAFDEELEKEPRDYTKIIWVVIIVMVIGMIAAVWYAGRPKPGESIVYTKHILITYDPANAADRQRALERAQQLREEILHGANFEELATQYSSDPTSASRGGHLPPFRRSDELERNFAQFAWNAPVGTLSDVISTMHGFHLIIVTERFISPEDAYNMELEQRANEAARGEAPADTANTPAAAPAP